MYDSSVQIVIILGPTSVGKTRLTHEIERIVREFHADECAENPQMMPFAKIKPKPRGSAQFSWKYLFGSVCRKLGHPFVKGHERKPPSPIWEKESSEFELTPLKPSSTDRLSGDWMFEIMQNTVRRRSCKVICVDEAHHVLHANSLKQDEDQAELLKFMADETDALLVLVGTYRLTRLLEINGAFDRRCEIIHFPRYIYNPSVPDDQFGGFSNALAEFNVDLESYCKVDLLDNVSDMFTGSVGCVGGLRNWLKRAWTRSQNTSRKLITSSILEQEMKESYRLLNIVREAKSGEEFFGERKNHKNELNAALGFFEQVVTSKASPDIEPNSLSAKPSPQKTKRKRRPGARSPHNDQVGIKKALRLKEEK